jgi:hypothetical protein
MQNSWSRAVLTHQIESGLYQRSGKAITNFQTALPASHSDLARQTLKDPYNFDFLMLREQHDEQELENALMGSRGSNGEQGVRLRRYQVCFPSKVFGKSGDKIPINNALFGIMFPDHEGTQGIQGARYKLETCAH